MNDVRKTNPDVLFLLENVKMGKKWEPVFDNAIGCKGNHINSALVSAQTRKRIYWTNIQGGIIPQPKDEGLTISDISEYEVDEKYYLSEKVLNNLAFHLKRNHDKGNHYGANIKTKDEKSNTVTVKGKYMYDLICVAMRGRNPENLHVENLVLKQFRKIILFYKYQEDLTKVDFMKIRLQHYLVIHMIETILSYREHYMAISE